MAGRLDGQVAVITGAGRGLGRAYALAYAREGAAVVVNDRDGGLASSVADEIGGAAVASEVAVGTAEAAAAVVDTALDRFGRLDVMITNAGADRRGPVLDLTPDDWDFTLRTHLFGMIHCSVAAGRVMRRQGDGVIVNITSSAFYAGVPDLAAYGVAKGGVYGLMRSLAVELAPFGIAVNGVAPPLTATEPAVAFVESLRARGVPPDQVDAMRRSMPQPDDVAAITVFLATEEGRRLSGQLFTMTKDELTIIGPPPDERTITAPNGSWTLGDLSAAIIAAVAQPSPRGRR
jgi:NAD(P)-dependent dehydrogenase (short-subunit alcohol dehydrogenase family)